LVGCDFRGADFEGSNLRCAKLNDSDMRGADLSGADLSHACFTGCDLRGANLSRTKLDHASFSGANIEGAKIDFTSWPLWCGSLNVKIDEQQAAQLSYHLASILPEWMRVFVPGLATIANAWDGLKRFNLDQIDWSKK
jgi:uncharacterized protein YjbI with pentapeptide repeats